jgi:hypothetical protein
VDVFAKNKHDWLIDRLTNYGKQTMVNLLAWFYRHLLGEWLDFYQFEVSFVIPHKFLRTYPTFAMVSSLNMFLAVPRNSENLHDTSTSWCFGGTPGAGVSQKALNMSLFLVAFMWQCLEIGRC